MHKVSGPLMSTIEVNPEAFSGSRLYISRDLSLLEFQRRVLDQARDERNPILERVKFLAIFGSNMDEFFMLRVSGLHRGMPSRSPQAPGVDLDLSAELTAVRKLARELYTTALQCLHKNIVPQLEKSGIRFL